MNECIELITKVDVFGLIVAYSIFGFCIGLLVGVSKGNATRKNNT